MKINEIVLEELGVALMALAVFMFAVFIISFTYSMVVGGSDIYYRGCRIEGDKISYLHCEDFDNPKALILFIK